MNGRIHSLQSFGAADGPGIRFVVFLSGCPLRCGCCHNPDTWNMSGGKEMSAEEIFARVLRFREYFGENGGVTVSGGEPLMQSDFCAELFSLCREAGIGTCLDTSGCILDGGAEHLLELCGLVLLDIKYTDAESYRRYVGCEYESVLGFYRRLLERGVPMWLRQVVIPGLNDSEENYRRLARLRDESGGLVRRIELLPFRKLCTVKYDALGIEFPFRDIPEPQPEAIERAYAVLNA